MTISGGKGQAALRPQEALAEGFDQPHLARYTLDNPELEREIVGLFLQQLPQIVGHLKAAGSSADWKMAAHTLKGSAAAVGATAIHAAALALEASRFDVDAKVNASLIAQLDADIARFRHIVTSLYGTF